MALQFMVIKNMVEEVMENKIVYSLIVAILNRGFSDIAMSAARNAGAKGGTVISAN